MCVPRSQQRPDGRKDLSEYFVMSRASRRLATLTLAMPDTWRRRAFLEGVIAFKLRPVPGSGWLLFDGISRSLIAAIIASAWPASAAWAVGVLVGVALISSGLARLMVSIAVRRVVA